MFVEDDRGQHYQPGGVVCVIEQLKRSPFHPWGESRSSSNTTNIQPHCMVALILFFRILDHRSPRHSARSARDSQDNLCAFAFD